MRVLIIENEAVIAFNVQTILAEIGYTASDLVDTEAEAVGAAEQRWPDLIVADERLRMGSGIDAARTICARRLVPTVHILGVFGDAFGRAVDHAVCIGKPFIAERLIEAVHRAVSRVEEKRRAIDKADGSDQSLLRLVD